MNLHLFMSEKNLELCCLTTDPRGVNLPEDLGPWKLAGAPISLDRALKTASPETASQIQENGFVLLKSAAMAKFRTVQ
jgi:hypothetical protein